VALAATATATVAAAASAVLRSLPTWRERTVLLSRC
jgi:hypothetical protein